MGNVFLSLLEEKHTLLIDGATGTNLFALGLQSGDSPEFWNTDTDDRSPHDGLGCGPLWMMAGIHAQWNSDN